MIRPNCLIIGAPKCGTSSLFSWLVQHPEVSGTTKKETFLLMDPGHPLGSPLSSMTSTERAFDAYFNDDAKHATVRLEATTHHLFQKKALDAVSSWPDARVIVVLREPAARVFSSYSFTQHNLARLNPELGFADYLDLLKEGVTLFPDWCQDEGSAYVLERDLAYSAYYNYLERWMTALGSKRVYVIPFEQLRAEPMCVLNDLSDWLGISSGVLDEKVTVTHNKTSRVRSRTLQAAAWQLNEHLRLPKPIRHFAKSALAKLQGSAAVKMSQSEELALKSLRSSYHEQNEKLARLTGLDLAYWWLAT